MDLPHDFSLPEGFPAGSAFLDGHFPGNPIVPGAVILGYLAARLREEGLGVRQVQRMKFSRPLRPETPFGVHLSSRASGVRAEFRDADGVFAGALLVLGEHRD